MLLCTIPMVVNSCALAQGCPEVQGAAAGKVSDLDPLALHPPAKPLRTTAAPCSLEDSQRQLRAGAGQPAGPQKGSHHCQCTRCPLLCASLYTLAHSRYSVSASLYVIPRR